MTIDYEQLEEEIKKSKCFGVAYDAETKECKLCHASKACKIAYKKSGNKPKSPNPNAENLISISDIKKSKNKDSNAKKSRDKVTKPKKESKGDSLPDFKIMTNKELENLAKARGIQSDQVKLKKKYSDARIYRMRLTMAVKATYSK